MGSTARSGDRQSGDVSCIAQVVVKDSDKTLDLAEVKAAAAAHFDKLNKDSDDTLDAKELAPTARRLRNRSRSRPRAELQLQR